jgi:hypothetical protein
MTRSVGARYLTRSVGMSDAAWSLEGWNTAWNAHDDNNITVTTVTAARHANDARNHRDSATCSRTRVLCEADALPVVPSIPRDHHRRQDVRSIAFAVLARHGSARDTSAVAAVKRCSNTCTRTHTAAHPCTCTCSYTHIYTCPTSHATTHTHAATGSAAGRRPYGAHTFPVPADAVDATVSRQRTAEATAHHYILVVLVVVLDAFVALRFDASARHTVAIRVAAAAPAAGTAAAALAVAATTTTTATTAAIVTCVTRPAADRRRNRHR